MDESIRKVDDKKFGADGYFGDKYSAADVAVIIGVSKKHIKEAEHAQRFKTVDRESMMKLGEALANLIFLTRNITDSADLMKIPLVKEQVDAMHVLQKQIVHLVGGILGSVAHSVKDIFSIYDKKLEEVARIKASIEKDEASGKHEQAALKRGQLASLDMRICALEPTLDVLMREKIYEARKLRVGGAKSGTAKLGKVPNSAMLFTEIPIPGEGRMKTIVDPMPKSGDKESGGL